jgi:hypothetical protein
LYGGVIGTGEAAEVQAVEAIKCFDIFARIAAVAATAYTLQGRLRRRWEAVCYAYYNNNRNISGTSN